MRKCVGELTQVVGEVTHVVGEMKQFCWGNKANSWGNEAILWGCDTKLVGGMPQNTKCSIPIQMAATCCVPFHQDTSGTGLPPLASHLSIWLRANNNLVLPIFQSGHSNAHTAVIFLLCLPDHNKRALRVRPNG